MIRQSRGTRTLLIPAAGNVDFTFKHALMMGEKSAYHLRHSGP